MFIKNLINGESKHENFYIYLFCIVPHSYLHRFIFYVNYKSTCMCRSFT